MKELAQSPEAVAYTLLRDIINLENKHHNADRNYILSTYADCLKATRGNYAGHEVHTARVKEFRM